MGEVKTRLEDREESRFVLISLSDNTYLNTFY